MRVVRSHLLVSVAATSMLAFLAASTKAEVPQVVKVQKGVKVQGHIVHIKGPNQVVVRTADNRDVILNVNPQTTYMLRDKAVVFTEVREGVPVQVVYDANGDQYVAGAFTLTPTEVVEGEIVRVIEPDNQLVIRGAGGKEVIFVTEPQTSFTFENKQARLADFRPGTMVRVHFDMRNQRNFAHSVWTMSKK